MPGIGGLDAHAYPHRIGPITIYIFRYKVLFKGIRTHVLVREELSTDVSAAKKTVMDALKSACCFISNFRWGDARGFRFEARSGNTDYSMGGTIRGGTAEFRVTTPLPGYITLVRDGKDVLSKKGRELVFSTEERGAYRVVVRRKKRPWIYSNHIRLLEGD